MKNSNFQILIIVTLWSSFSKKNPMKDGGSPLKALNTIHSTPKKHQNLCDVFIFTPCNILNL
jgi:hypothetical protein